MAAIPAKASVWDIGVEDIVVAGLSPEEARAFHSAMRRAAGEHSAEGSEAEVWRDLSAGVLRPSHPHALHQLVYYSVYARWDAAARGPPPYWFPSPIHSKHTNLGRLMEVHGPKLLGSSYHDPITSFSLFQKFSVNHPEAYWSIVVKELSVIFRKAPKSILDTSNKSKDGGIWFPGAVLNISECCLLPSSKKTDESAAILWRNEDSDDSRINHLSLRELRDQVMLVASALDKLFTKGDAIAIDMPMTSAAVIIYLAIILAGYVVVSIADSFAAREIATRMSVSKAKGIFTQDFIIRGERNFPLYSRVIEGSQCKAIVIPARGNNVGVKLRKNDLSWKDFLSQVDDLPRIEAYLYMEATSQESRGPGQNKRNWSEEEDIKLIEAMLDLHNIGTYNAEGGFKPGFFNALEKMLVVSLPQSGIKADPHIRSRVKTLKGHFAIVHDMLYGPNTSGFGYDDTTKSVVAEKPVWDAYIQSHKKAGMFKDKPFPYYRELCIIFGKDRATGAHAETAADAVEEIEREAATMAPDADDDFDILVDGIDTMDFSTSPNPASMENASDAGSSRKKRKKKMEKSVEETIVEITERSTTTIITQMDKSADKISRAIQDGDMRDLRGKLHSELLKVAGLTREECIRALTKIASDRALAQVFFSLEDEYKEEYIRSIIE